MPSLLKNICFLVVFGLVISDQTSPVKAVESAETELQSAQQLLESADYMHGQGRYISAGWLYDEALRLRLVKLKHNHDEVLQVMRQISANYAVQLRWQEALGVLRRINLKLRNRKPGTSYDAYFENRFLSLKLEFEGGIRGFSGREYDHLIDEIKNKKGNADPLIARALGEQGLMFARLGEEVKALPLLKQAIVFPGSGQIDMQSYKDVILLIEADPNEKRAHEDAYKTTLTGNEAFIDRDFRSAFNQMRQGIDGLEKLKRKPVYFISVYKLKIAEAAKNLDLNSTWQFYLDAITYTEKHMGLEHPQVVQAKLDYALALMQKQMNTQARIVLREAKTLSRRTQGLAGRQGLRAMELLFNTYF